MIPSGKSLNQNQLSFVVAESKRPEVETNFSQEVPPQKGFSRKEYNRRYYQVNKDRINARKNSLMQSKIVPLFSKTGRLRSDAPRVLSKIFRWVELILFLIAAVVMTLYLVKESAVFYLEGHEALLSAYIKGAMVEGMGIIFSFSRGTGKVLRLSQRVVMVLLCSLTLFTMSCKVFRSATHDSKAYRITSQAVKELEVELEEKTQLRKTFVEREWIGATRRYDKDLLQVRQKLGEARQKLGSMEAPDVVMGSLVILIVFRILVVATNLICIHRVVELMTNETPQKGPILVRSDQEFTLNST